MKYYCDISRHLICEPYSILNLHAMAKALNIKRHHFFMGKYPHYDIPKRRIKEIQKRATLVPTKEIYLKIKAAYYRPL